MRPAQREVRRALGGTTARAFLEAHPRVDYLELRGRLGTPLVPIKLVEGLGLECKEDACAEWFARDLFVRELREGLPAGWKRGDFEINVALGAATASLEGVGEAVERHADRAHNYLLGALFIPEGWLPETPDDPFLVEAFEATRAGDLETPDPRDPDDPSAPDPRVTPPPSSHRSPQAGASIDASPFLVPAADLDGVSDEELPRAAVARMMTQVDIYDDDASTYLDGLRSATAGQVAVFAVVWFDSEVCNGGFHQFFYNPTGIVAREVVHGFRRLGATPCAEMVVKAMARFPGGIAPRERDRRIAVLERSPYSEWKEFFGPLEDAYYDLQDTVENLEAVCSRYIRAHLSEFVRPSPAGREQGAVASPRGRRVVHTRFGEGTVIAGRDGQQTKLEIAFDDGVIRTLLSRFVTDI